MQLLYWNEIGPDGTRGTIQCTDGHVLLVRVPKAHLAGHQDVVRELANSLERVPPTIQQAADFLEASGYERADWNGHVAFVWPDNADPHIKASADEVLPAGERYTETELKALKVDALKAIGETLGVDPKLKKDELVAAILEAQQEQADE